MTAAEVAVRGRLAAEELMIDACSITAAAGLGTFDSDTGAYTAPAAGVVYGGPCQVQVTDSLAARTPQAGETEITIQKLLVKIPVAATGTQVGQIVTITAVGDGSDPELVGKRFRIEATHAKTYATARRLQCEEVTRT